MNSLICIVYDVGWLEANLTSSKGPDNTVGSIRIISSGSLVGTYEFVEKVQFPFPPSLLSFQIKVSHFCRENVLTRLPHNS